MSVAVDSAAIATTSEIERSSRINTYYLEVWIYGNTAGGTNSPITWGIFKNPGNNLTPISPELAGSSDMKKQYWSMGKGLVGNNSNGQPGYLIRGWFSIPNTFRTMRSQDQMTLRIKNDSGANINICFLCIYKWYK